MSSYAAQIRGVLELSGATFPSDDRMKSAIGALIGIIREAEHHATPHVDILCPLCEDYVPVGVIVEPIETVTVNEAGINMTDMAMTLRPDQADMQAHVMEKHPTWRVGLMEVADDE